MTKPVVRKTKTDIRPGQVPTQPSARLRLRIGNQTSFAAASPTEPLQFAVVNGFTAFEFFPDRGFSGEGGWDERELGDEARRYIRQTAKAAGIQLSVHAPLEFNPLRASNSERLHSSVAFAKNIGARTLNLHLDASEGCERFRDALRPTLVATSQVGLQLVLENTVHTGPNEFNEFFNLLEKAADCPRDHVGMCFDLGHANLCVATRNDFLKFLDQLSPRVPIRHLHLHENYGDQDSHLPLFTGPAGEDSSGLRGLVKRLAYRAYDGCAILEQWPQPPELLVRARDQLLRLLEAQSVAQP